MSNFVLDKSTVNNVVVTVSERSRLTDPFFLVVFSNKFSTSEVLKSCSLKSDFSNPRYDLFIIEEKTDPDPLSGEVYLIEGEWSYEVYESTEQTLIVSETTERILQRGLVIVKDN